jgi:hypothetical protein
MDPDKQMFENLFACLQNCMYFDGLYDQWHISIVHFRNIAQKSKKYYKLSLKYMFFRQIFKIFSVIFLAL